MARSIYHPDKRPKNTAAHHLVALTDPRAQVALQILVNFDISADNAANGVDLPRYKCDQGHKNMPDAIAHSKIHTKSCFANVEAVLLNVINIPDMTREDVIKALRGISKDLQEGIFPVTGGHPSGYDYLRFSSR